jgi:hypothetical protein
MRSLLLCSILSVGVIGYAIAQQTSIVDGPPNPPIAVSPPPIKANPPQKPSRLTCADICNKAVTEISLSADDKKWFAQCAGALFCQGKPALPLASQPDTDAMTSVRRWLQDWLS